MKKTCFLISTILSFGSVCLGQEIADEQKQKKSYFKIAAGPAFPDGDFADQNSSGGLAQTGYLLEMGVELGLSEYAGFLASIRRVSNSYNEELLQEDLSKSNPGIEFHVYSENYVVLGFMSGFFGQIPLNKESGVQLQMRALIGVMNCTYPQIKINSSEHFNSIEETYYKTNRIALGYSLGGGFHFEINKKTKFFINMDYLAAQADFKLKYGIESSKGQISYSSKDQKLFMQTINFGFGFAILFL